jgi:CHRD domain
MRSSLCVFGLSCVMAVSLAGDSQERSFRARLRSIQEVPAVSSVATGEFRAKVNAAGTELSYELEYSGLEGTVTQSHIHLGQAGVNGGIMIWLCGTSTNPGPAGTPTCPPAPGGKVSRTVIAADVVGPAGQGVAAGEFAEALRGMRNGVSYANVHSTMWPGGEIRGQIKSDED